MMQNQNQSQRIWWVNQGQTYDVERAGGYVWAPKFKRNGATGPVYWQRMRELRPGDILVHYSKGEIRAIGSVLSKARSCKRPTALDEVDRWEKSGWRVDVQYADLVAPIEYAEIPIEWQADVTRSGPFVGAHAAKPVKIGYLFPLDPEFYESLTEEFWDRIVGARQPKPDEFRSDDVARLEQAMGLRVFA
jgi:hypothetical protein